MSDLYFVVKAKGGEIREIYYEILNIKSENREYSSLPYEIKDNIEEFCEKLVYYNQLNVELNCLQKSQYCSYFEESINYKKTKIKELDNDHYDLGYLESKKVKYVMSEIKSIIEEIEKKLNYKLKIMKKLKIELNKN